MKRAKKVAKFTFGFLACFAVVLSVSAASYKTLTYQENHRITVESIGTKFKTTINASSVSNTPTVKTQVGRKMFGLVWYDSASNTTVFKGAGKSTSTWNANGTWPTRATWTNITSGSSITAAFELYES